VKVDVLGGGAEKCLGDYYWGMMDGCYAGRLLF